jgi:cyanuric acid amidohydrolase
MEEIKQIPIVWSGGTDGVISRTPRSSRTVAGDSVPQTDEPRLSVGYAMSEQICPRTSAGCRWSRRSPPG